MLSEFIDGSAGLPAIPDVLLAGKATVSFCNIRAYRNSRSTHLGAEREGLFPRKAVAYRVNFGAQVPCKPPSDRILEVPHDRPLLCDNSVWAIFHFHISISQLLKSTTVMALPPWSSDSKETLETKGCVFRNSARPRRRAP